MAACGGQALRIRILRSLRVRFIVEELSATEMRSYSRTDFNKHCFMSVINNSGRRKLVNLVRNTYASAVQLLNSALFHRGPRDTVYLFDTISVKRI